jgi:hydrogenase maturation protease
MTPVRRILVIGFGNPGRRDDGLGPALAARIAERLPPGVTAESAYQLEIEDAALAAEHDDVVFVDAARSGRTPFDMQPVEPLTHHHFTTHSLAPSSVLGIARDVLGAQVRGHLLAVRGEEFDVFEESLSPSGERNLEAALSFLRGWLAECANTAATTAGEARCATAST